MSLGELSTLLAWGTTTAYAIAFVAFAMDLAHLADARGAVVRARAERAPVAVGAGGGAGGGSVRGGTERGGTAAVAADVVRAPRRAVGIAMATATLGLAFQTAALVLRARLLCLAETGRQLRDLGLQPFTVGVQPLALRLEPLLLTAERRSLRGVLLRRAPLPALERGERLRARRELLVQLLLASALLQRCRRPALGGRYSSAGYSLTMPGLLSNI